MKKLFCKRLGGRVAVAVLSLLFVQSEISAHAAGTINPIDLTTNQWDCIVTGPGQQGIAFLSFDKEGTVSGPILLAPKPLNSGATGRNSGGNAGRGGTGGSTNSQTVLFGWTFIDNGQWMVDSKSNIIGFFTLEHQEPKVTCTTNLVTPDGTNFLEVVDCVTNFIGDAISFVAKGTPGKRLTLVSSTPNGTVTYRGVPFTGTNVLDGTWTGVKKENGQIFNEFFTLSTAFPNMFSMVGSGPGYTYDDGVCLVSSQKRIGFAMHEVGNLGTSTNKLLRATVGPFNPKTTAANTSGLKDPDVTITFKAAKLP